MITQSDFDTARAERVLDLYKTIVGGNITLLTPESFVAAVKNGDAFITGWRLGSKWDMHSKLKVTQEGKFLRFSFYENFDPSERSKRNPSYLRARRAVIKFAKETSELV